MRGLLGHIIGAQLAYGLRHEARGVDDPLRVTGMMVTARVANLGRAQRAPLEMRAAGEKNSIFEPFFKGGKQYFEDSFLQLGLQPLHFAPNAGPELTSLLTSLPCVPLFAAAALTVRALCAHFEQSFS